MSRAIAGVDAAATGADAAEADEIIDMVVPLAAKFLQLFLTLHPYVNGNGHIGRLIVWILLGRYEIWPKSWPLDISPPYSTMLMKHRDRDVAPLEDFIFRAIIGEISDTEPNSTADRRMEEAYAAAELTLSPPALPIPMLDAPSVDDRAV